MRISMSEKRETVKAPWVEATLRSLQNSAPTIKKMLDGGKYLKVVGPGDPKDVVASLMDSNGKKLGTLVKDGKIVGQAQFEEVAQGLNSVDVTALAFQALSVVTSQYYLHNINTKLASLEDKMEDIIQHQTDQQAASIKSSLDIISELYEGHSTIITDAEFHARAANAEKALRDQVNATEAALKRKMSESKAAVTAKDGTRKKESYDDFLKKTLVDLHSFYETDETQMYLLSLQGMIQWYQIAAANDVANGKNPEIRLKSMKKFLSARAAVAVELQEQQEFILSRSDDPGIKDQLKKAGVSFVKGGITGGSWALPSTPMAFIGLMGKAAFKIHPFLKIAAAGKTVADVKSTWSKEDEKQRDKFDTQRMDKTIELDLIADSFNETSAQILDFTQRLEAPNQEFYISYDEENDELQLALAA